MKRLFLNYALAGILLLNHNLEAVPTAAFWTNCTTEIQEKGHVNFEVDNYFNMSDGRLSSKVPTDVGVTLGLFEWGDISCEVGVDYLIGTNDPFYFSGKFGMQEEGKLFKNAPSWNIGCFNAGTRGGKTNQNVLDLIIGKSLPNWIGDAAIYFAGYYGNRSIGTTRGGWMVAYRQNFCKSFAPDGREFHKWVLFADYCSGRNTIGGGGVALAYYFNPDVLIESGPIFFNDAHTNGTWKWSVQLSVVIPVFTSR